MSPRGCGRKAVEPLSSNTQIRFVPRVVHTVDASGRQAVDLNQAIGPGAAQVLLETLHNMEVVQSRVRPELRDMVAWKRDRSTGVSERYLLEAPANCRPSGVDRMEISIEIGGAVAEIRHKCKYTLVNQAVAPVQEVIQQQVRQAVNRSVNQLLALSVAQKIEQRVQQHVRPELRNQVKVKMTQQFNIRTQAFVRR